MPNPKKIDKKNKNKNIKCSQIAYPGQLIITLWGKYEKKKFGNKR